MNNFDKMVAYTKTSSVMDVDPQREKWVKQAMAGGKLESISCCKFYCLSSGKHVGVLFNLVFFELYGAVRGMVSLFYELLTARIIGVNPSCVATSETMIFFGVK